MSAMRVFLTSCSFFVCFGVSKSYSTKDTIPFLLMSLFIFFLINLLVGLELMAVVSFLVFSVTLLFLYVLSLSLEGTNPQNPTMTQTQPHPYLIIFFLILCLAYFLPVVELKQFVVPNCHQRWVDFISIQSNPLSSMFSLIHFLLTRLFTVEGLLLNFLIFLTLLASIYLAKKTPSSSALTLPKNVALPHNFKKSWSRPSSSRIR